MRQIIHCYANWRIHIILLLGVLAMLLASAEGPTLLTNITGTALLLADLLVARKWHRQGKLPQIDDITE